MGTAETLGTSYLAGKVRSGRPRESPASRWCRISGLLVVSRAFNTPCWPAHIQSYPMFPSRGKPRSRTPVTPTPVSTPTSPEESFIRKKFSTLHRGDVKTLAASAIALVSSIGSPSLNQSYRPRLDEQNATHTSHLDLDAIGQGSESSSHRAVGSAWQTAYRTARMALDITKELSDPLPPLKAVVGALSVLIKNYDVSSIPVTTGFC